jgi:hypothetical protein
MIVTDWIRRAQLTVIVDPMTMVSLGRLVYQCKYRELIYCQLRIDHLLIHSGSIIYNKWSALNIATKSGSDNTKLIASNAPAN